MEQRMQPWASSSHLLHQTHPLKEEEQKRSKEEILHGWEKAEAEAAFLRQELAAAEKKILYMDKENSSLKYELAVLGDELQTRGEERERQSLAMAKRVSELEAETQRLRGILRRRGPTTGAMTTMTLTEISALTGEKMALTAEKAALTEALERKTREAEAAWSLCSRTAARLARAETEIENWRREKPDGGDLGLMSDFLEMEKSVSMESSVESAGPARPEARPEIEVAVKKLTEAVNTVRENGSSHVELSLLLNCKKTELEEVLNGMGKACDGFLDQGNDLESFLVALASAFEWIIRRCSDMTTITPTTTMKTSPGRDKELEIATATEKLAECQETILSLGKQIRALGAPTDAPLHSLDKVIASGRARAALVDWILADCDKNSASAAGITSTSGTATAVTGAVADAGKGMVEEVKALHEEKKDLTGPIVVAQKRPKRGVGMILGRLLMRRKGKSARKMGPAPYLSLGGER